MTTVLWTNDSRGKEKCSQTIHYRWTTIGSMDHLDAAKLEEFKDFNKKFYIPNNAVLVVAGDFNAAQTKEWIQKYFGAIKKETAIERETS
jgi:predicted Zn-dependent peptidase